MSRDRTVGETFYILFTTRSFVTGVPTVLAGTPVVSAYEDGSTTQITAGITLGVDHDSVVGLNLLTLVATGANGYEAGKDYHMVITTGTVGGVSVVGEVVGDFSLGLSAAFTRLGAPAGASVSADIAVIDANVDQIETAVITNAVGADVSADIATAQADLDTITGSDGVTLATAQALYAPAKTADILSTALSEVYSTDGSAPTLTQAVMGIQQFLQERATSSTTVTVKKLDGSTTAMTFTLDDATTPTSITRTT